MKTATSALLLAAACLFGRPAGAAAGSGRETLADLLARERRPDRVPRPLASYLTADSLNSLFERTSLPPL
jgi:hypothetical protein